MSNIDLNTTLKELLEKHIECDTEGFRAEAICNYWKDDYHMHTTITSDKIFDTEDEAESDMREFIINDMYSYNVSDFTIETYRVIGGNNLLICKKRE